MLEPSLSPRPVLRDKLRHRIRSLPHTSLDDKCFRPTVTRKTLWCFTSKTRICRTLSAPGTRNAPYRKMDGTRPISLQPTDGRWRLSQRTAAYAWTGGRRTAFIVVPAFRAASERSQQGRVVLFDSCTVQLMQTLTVAQSLQ